MQIENEGANRGPPEREELEALTGRVKWFDPGKGYGFVAQDHGGADIFIHATCARTAGHAVLTEGARATVLCRMGPCGLQAEKILELAEPEALTPNEGAGARPTEVLRSGPATGPLEPARVKWFEPERGYGFVNVFGSPADVFVHMETVRRFGFQALRSGESVAVRTVRGPRGLMVAELRLWEASFFGGVGA